MTAGVNERAFPRRATSGDAPALNALARAAYAVYVPVVGREPQPMATDWQTLFDAQEIWIVDGPTGPIASLALEIEPASVVIWSVNGQIPRPLKAWGILVPFYRMRVVVMHVSTGGRKSPVAPDPSKS